MVCKHCNIQVSNSYKRCPKCGRILLRKKALICLRAGIIAAVIMLVAAVFVAGFLMGRNRTERHCGANLTWKYENNMLYINGEGDMWDYDANSPWHNLRKRIKAIEMHGVESIGDSAFLDLDLLTNITIPYGVTSIGNEAFKRCVSLESIVIPDSVTSISYWAFNDCDSLKTIYFTGTEAQWNALGLSQNDINNATVTFAE